MRMKEVAVMGAAGTGYWTEERGKEIAGRDPSTVEWTRLMGMQEWKEQAFGRPSGPSPVRSSVLDAKLIRDCQRLAGRRQAGCGSRNGRTRIRSFLTDANHTGDHPASRLKTEHLKFSTVQAGWTGGTGRRTGHASGLMVVTCLRIRKGVGRAGHSDRRRQPE
jgi:hypothetical protein